VSYNFGKFSLSSTDLDWQRAGIDLQASTCSCKLMVSSAGGKLCLEVKNTSADDLFLRDITIRFAPGDQQHPLQADQWMEYINGFSFDDLGAGVKKVGLVNETLANNPNSSLVYVLSARNRAEAFLVGTVPPHRRDNVAFKALHESGHLEGNFGLAITFTVEALIKPGKSFRTTSVLVETGEDPLKLLESFGDFWRDRRSFDLKARKKGWNSWDYFSGAVEAEDIYRNQDCAKEHFGDEVEYFVIDEGYEPRWGVWEANWKFPDGLEAYCKRVTAAGGKPGIWTSALLVNTYTTLYREHPDWFACDEDGDVQTKLFSYGPMAYLDVTHPEVEKHLAEVFGRLRRAGFVYFKVDFTQCVLQAKRFHDRTVPRGQILRKAFGIIRKAIGEDAYLLSCGAPYESVTDLVDATRATGDIHNFWGHVKHNAASMAARWWMHRKLWNNDPDFLIVRTPETCSLPELNRPHKELPSGPQEWWLRGRDLSMEEMKTYALTVYMSAGDLMLSDDLCTLNEQGRAVIRKVLERPLANAAVPVDIFKSHAELPAVWISQQEDFSVVTCFNWGEDDKEVVVSLDELKKKPVSIRTFWDDEPVAALDGVLAATLAPRAAASFVIEH
jgi:hypothetical protein